MAPRPPNYNQARGDRNRAKEQKKQERLRRREEDPAPPQGRKRPPETGAGADESAEAVPPPASPSSPESLPDLKNSVLIIATKGLASRDRRIPAGHSRERALRISSSSLTNRKSARSRWRKGTRAWSMLGHFASRAALRRERQPLHWVPLTRS